MRKEDKVMKVKSGPGEWEKEMAGVGVSTNCCITDLPFSLTPSTNTHVHVSRGNITHK